MLRVSQEVTSLKIGQEAPKPKNGLSSITCDVPKLWEYTVYVCST